MTDEHRQLSPEKADWLDEQEFFDILQAYRYPGWNGLTHHEALEAVKKYIRDQINVARTIAG